MAARKQATRDDQIGYKQISPRKIAGDVITDFMSGIAGPIASGAISIGEQMFTDNSIEEMVANNEAYNNALNYNPITEEAQLINQKAMQGLGTAVNEGIEYYDRNKDQLTPQVQQTISGVGDWWEELDPRKKFLTGNVATVAEVLPLGGAVKAGLRVGRNAVDRRKLNNAASQVPDEMEYAPLQERLEEMGARQLQVKEKGGNWPTIVGQSSPTSVIETLIRDTYQGFDGQTLNKPGEAAVSAWLRKKGTKYITKEMGTGQGDSLVQMFDQYNLEAAEIPGTMSRDMAPVVHFDPDTSPRMFDPIPPTPSSDTARSKLTSSTPLARRFERIGDDSIHTTTIGELTDSERDELFKNQPFYATAPDTDVVHFLKSEGLGFNLGLDIIADELGNMVDPDNWSHLPAELLMTESDLTKMTMAQASKKVGEVRLWRATEADRVARVEAMEFIENDVVFTDPDFSADTTRTKKGKKKVDVAAGMTFYNIDDVLDNDLAMDACNIIGKDGGWCTQHKNWADDYTKDDKYIVAGLDTEGRSQIQISLRNVLDGEDDVSGTRVIEIDEIQPLENSLSSNKVKEMVKKDPDYLDKVMTSTTKYLNDLDATEDLRKVKLDQVYGEIADISLGVNALPGFAKGSTPSLTRMVNELFGGDGAYTPSIFKLLQRPTRVGQELPRFMTKKQLKEFIEENGTDAQKTVLNSPKASKAPNNAMGRFVNQVRDLRDQLTEFGVATGLDDQLLVNMNVDEVIENRTSLRAMLDSAMDSPETEYQITAARERHADLVNDFQQLQIDNGAAAADLAVYTEDELLNMGVRDLSLLVGERIDFANNLMDAQIDEAGMLDDAAPDEEILGDLLDQANAPDYTLEDYRDLALTDAGVMDNDRLQGMHAMVQASGWDETGEIRVDLTDPLMNDGVWPERFDELREHALGWTERFAEGLETIDSAVDGLFLQAANAADRQWFINNYSSIRQMILDGHVPNADGTFNYDNGVRLAQGGHVTYNPEQISKLSESLLAGNYYEGGPVTYDFNKINQLAERLMETSNV